MRVSTSQLQQLTIFTTVLTGAGIGTMYYLMQKQENQDVFTFLCLPGVPSVFTVYPIYCFLFGVGESAAIGC